LGYLNKIFGENIGAKIGTAIGIGPVAGQIASDVLSEITPGSSTATTVQPTNTGPIETADSGIMNANMRTNMTMGNQGVFRPVSNQPPIGDYVIDQFPQQQFNMGRPQQVAIPALFGANVIGGLAAAIAGALELYQAGFFAKYQVKPPRFTRKLQSQMRQLIPLVGIDAVAEKFGTSTNVVGILLMKRFPARPIVISRAKIRTCEKLGRDVNRAVMAVSGIKKLLPGTTRRAAPKRIPSMNGRSPSKSIAIA
jgi:hypothetical protein